MLACFQKHPADVIASSRLKSLPAGLKIQGCVFNSNLKFVPLTIKSVILVTLCKKNVSDILRIFTFYIPKAGSGSDLISFWWTGNCLWRFGRPKTVVQGLGPYLGRTADVFFCPTGLVPCWDFVFGFDDIPHSLSSAGPRGRCSDAQDAQNNISQFGPTWTVPLTKIDTPPHWFFKHPNGPHFFNICLQFDKKIII